MGYGFFLMFALKVLVTVRVVRIGGTTHKVEQEVNDIKQYIGCI